MPQPIYHCVGHTPTRYWRFTGNAPISVEADTQIQSNNSAARGIWKFGQNDIWVSGQGAGSISTSMVLRMSPDNGAVWSNQQSRIPYASPYAQDNRGLWGYGDDVAGKLWVVHHNNYSIIQSPDPMDANPFVERHSDTPPYATYTYIYGAYDDTYGLRIWFTRYNHKIYFSNNGTSFSEDNMTNLGSVGSFDPICVWVDGTRNRVWLLHRSGSVGNYTFKVFYKPADDITTAWTLDETWGPYASTPPSGEGRRFLHGDQTTGSVYIWSHFVISSLNTGQLWRRDPDTTVWSMEKETLNPGGTLSIYVLDDENLLCVGDRGVQKDSGGYHTYGTGEDYVWPSSRVGAAVYGEYAPYAIVEIEEGYGAGFSTIYDEYYFLSPYDTASSIVFDDSDGYDGYNFEISKGSDFDLGRISVNLEIDGYDDPINVDPEPSSYDQPRDSVIKFRLRK